jgi:hypothetical protein
MCSKLQSQSAPSFGLNLCRPLLCVVCCAGTGLTDWDNCSMYGKLMLFIFAAWAGAAVSWTL